MAKSASKPVEITAESLQLDVPSSAAHGQSATAGGNLIPTVVVSDETHEAQAKWVESAKAVRAAANAKPNEDAPEPEHVDIGLWEAIRWRGRPLWRHRRTGSTLSKHSEVRRQRNLK